MRVKQLTSDVDAVSWLYFVDQVVVSVHYGGVRGLPSRHVIRRLLHFDLKRGDEKKKRNQNEKTRVLLLQSCVWEYTSIGFVF